MSSHQYTTTLGNQTLTIGTGKLAQLAGGAVTLRCGDTVVLATATMSSNPREGISFFPLTVDYEEKLYAAGRIPGSFFRREGRPTESGILTARLVDRPLRPLFPSDMRNDVQVVITSLSQDDEHQADILAIIGASAALSISDVPFNGPIGATRVGYIDEELVVNPTISQMADSLLDLRLAGTADALLMVEAGANEVDEDVLVRALKLGHEAIQETISVQNQMRDETGKAKQDYPHYTQPEALKDAVLQQLGDRLPDALFGSSAKSEQSARLRLLRNEAIDQLKEDWDRQYVLDAFDSVERDVVRKRTLDEGIRVDGRTPDKIRPLSAEVGLLPMPHGSALFTRGETQALSVVTLGTPREVQKLDDLSPEDSKRYIHHYNFPPYCTGEARPLRGPKRREIGHGALAARALLPVIPDEGVFPYTIRVVSEIMSSNGSSSMASVCGSTLSLMDAGVPISAPVAGIAMGLMMDDSRYRILTDIQGMEDHLGDMDFKVAGTREGVTALQMDIKVSGISYDIMAEALEQAKEARMQILQVIEDTISAPRDALSPHAPRILITHVHPDKLGAVIGSGGKTVRGMQDEFDVRIDIEDDGTIYVASANGPDAEKALEMIAKLTEEAEIGRIYTGRVVRTTDFGAFVEILPGTDGLVHISQLSDHRVNKVEDVAKVGDEIMVMVTDVSPDGKIRLSRQAVLQGWTAEQARAADSRPKSSRGGRRRSNPSPRRR